MEIVRYEQYLSYTLSENPLDENEFRKYREQAYLILELDTGIDFSEYKPFNSNQSILINKALIYQIDYFQNNGLDIGNETAGSNVDVTVGKVHVGKSDSTSYQSTIYKRICPLSIAILDSLGLLYRGTFIKDCIY